MICLCYVHPSFLCDQFSNLSFWLGFEFGGVSVAWMRTLPWWLVGNSLSKLSTDYCCSSYKAVYTHTHNIDTRLSHYKIILFFFLYAKMDFKCCHSKVFSSVKGTAPQCTVCIAFHGVIKMVSCS